MIQPDQTFLDVIKTKLPQHADSIQTGEAVVEAKVSGEFGTLPPTILGLDPKIKQSKALLADALLVESTDKMQEMTEQKEFERVDWVVCYF